MQEYWINFVHGLAPSSAKGPQWPKYSDNAKVLDIQNYNSKQCGVPVNTGVNS